MGTHTDQSLTAGRSLLKPSKKDKAQVWFDDWNVFMELWRVIKEKSTGWLIYSGTLTIKLPSKFNS